jgi:sugar lactone lactonase YvrE
MVCYLKGISMTVPRLTAFLWLLGCPQVGNAASTWSVIPYPVKHGEVNLPAAVAVDPAGNLYVADQGVGVQKRDTQGDWTVIATDGTELGKVSVPTALAADSTGRLYVADRPGSGFPSGRIQQQDTQGNWSVIDAQGTSLDQYHGVTGLAVDPAGSLYVADSGNSRVHVHTPDPSQ